MDMQETEQLLLSAQRLKYRELQSESWEDPYSDMNPDEKSKLLIELMSRLKSAQEREERNGERINELLCQIQQLITSLQVANEEIRSLREQLTEYNKLVSENASLKEELRLAKKHRFGSKQQRGPGKPHDTTPVSHEEAKDGFDGTDSSLPEDIEEAGNNIPSASDSAAEAPHEKDIRLFRQGMKYRTMQADKRVEHKSDMSKLPEGAIVIEVNTRYSYDQVSQIVEHDWEVVRYKMPDGKIYAAYFPIEGEPFYVDKVPGTHATSGFLAYLAFDKYVLDTPLYREMYRITNEKMNIARSTLANWLNKGHDYIKEVVGHLMDICIQDGADINGDETWVRVKGKNNKYTKKYIWCCVNKKTKTVIYRYEEGSRGRDVLRHILGNKKLRSFQSDGYNVYMYFDKQMMDVEHICCMAHARAKFTYASDQGNEDAGYFLNCIAELYKLESDYIKGRLTPEQILACRQGLKTKEIIGRLRSKLDAMLSDGHPPYGELMDKALRYLKNFWTQLFNYLKNGEYTIDNSIAERCIRPLAGERKNSLFFGSDKMAVVSAAYHTVISTCGMHGISVLEYFKKFFRAIVEGRRDYINLLPQTIGITPNKY